jgi:hypothetical protein
MEIGIDFLTEKSDGEVAEILESGNRDDIRRELYPFVSGLTSGYVNDEQRSLLAWASTRALDRHRDIIEPRSFEEHLPHYRQNPIVLAAHTHAGFDAAEPTVIGKSLKEEIFPRKGLLFEPQFTDATELGEKYWRLYRDKVMQAWSVGIIPHEWERGKSTSDDEGPPPFRYRFTKVELIEISAVAVPANREALSKALQDGYELPEEIRDEFELPKGPSMVGASSKPSFTQHIRAVDLEMVLEAHDLPCDKGIVPANVSTRRAPKDDSWSKPTLSDFTDQSWGDLSAAQKRRIAGHFAWSEQMPPASFGSLKLPHHRSSDGAIVWRGVTAAVQRLLSSGQTRPIIPSEDRRKVYNHLAAHYRAFDEDPPEFRTVEEQTLEISFERDPVHNTRIFTVAECVVGDLTEAIEKGLAELVRATTVRWKEETKARPRESFTEAMEAIDRAFNQ